MERRKDNKGECVKEMCQEGKGGEGRTNGKKEGKENLEEIRRERKKRKGGAGLQLCFRKAVGGTP